MRPMRSWPSSDCGMLAASQKPAAHSRHTVVAGVEHGRCANATDTHPKAIQQRPAWCSAEQQQRQAGAQQSEQPHARVRANGGALWRSNARLTRMSRVMHPVPVWGNLPILLPLVCLLRLLRMLTWWRSSRAFTGQARLQRVHTEIHTKGSKSINGNGPF